jgi:hypothetical protein
LAKKKFAAEVVVTRKGSLKVKDRQGEWQTKVVWVMPEMER